MTLQLTAGNMLARTHTGRLLFHVTAPFRQLSGVLDFDPAAGTCHIDVTFQTASLQLPSAVIRSQVMSQSFLDPAEYPTQHYVGDCKGNRLAGFLTLRGQTHPFNMTIDTRSQAGQLVALHADGSFNRYQWGLQGLTMMVGDTIRITNDISLNGTPPQARE